MFENDKQLAPLTTFGVPAKARFFAEYSSLRELEWIVKQPQYTDNEVLHIGGGSNLLFMRDFDGLVLKSAIKGIEHYSPRPGRDFVIAGAGEKWIDLVEWCIREGYGGLENLAGIPGTVGAAPVQNVGAYGVEAGEKIFAVECFDFHTRKTVRFSAQECGFQYRWSRFKGDDRGRYAVLRVSFLLEKTNEARHLDYGPLQQMRERLGRVPTLREVADEVVKIRNSKLPDPAMVGSAGSFFKNPIVNRYYFKEDMQQRREDVPHYDIDETFVKIPAGWLIEHAGLKGATEGDAIVWPQQCLVIANRGNATAEDVARLAERVKMTVLEKFGVLLTPEVNYIDNSLEAVILGSGTSKGIPEVGCRCRMCISTDPRDKRTRSSCLVKTQGVTFLIDPGPDFRQQAIREGILSVDAVLITHSHYDHVGGIDDLRPFCLNGDLPMYMRQDVSDDLHRRLDYCFREHPYPGVPTFDVRIIDKDTPVIFRGVEIQPIGVFHGKLPILGFRFGKFAYVTDAKTIDEEEIEKLEGLDALVINGLRRKKHFAHFNREEALELIERVKPKRAWLTHLNHDNPLYAEEGPGLPENVHVAYDGLKIKVL